VYFLPSAPYSMDSPFSADAAVPAVDPSALERLRRFGGQKLLGDMITLFLAAAPERIAAAQTGLARHDASAVEHELHALKSSAAQLGALRMQHLSEQGELRAHAGTLDGAHDLLAELEAERVRVHAWLAAARDGVHP
jgi:HPt (histidine-containing phosphotransfer) domain-containing protein